MALPDQYRKDFAYLEDLSRKGTLGASNAIYQRLKDKARSLPEVQRALDTLRVNY